LPSTLTNGQKVRRIFQRKIFHARFTFWWRAGRKGTAPLVVD
jgi:hypothetical protein